MVDQVWMLKRRCLFHLPHGYLGIDVDLSQCFSYRNAMMSIPDEVKLSNLDQFHCWQTFPHIVGQRDAQPTTFSACLERPEVHVKFFAAPLTASDMIDGHRLSSRMVSVTYVTSKLNGR